ncbi:MAG: hypothetical protein M3040_13600 [Bacteroidota bacterium]|nr:hypothetical protein [Bacteroidota bacterium]
MPNNEQTVAAQAVLIALDGKSLLGHPYITTGNVQEAKVDTDTMNKAVEVLQQAGFSCHRSYPTCSITGKQALFEKIFHLQFGSAVYQSGTYIYPLNKATIPDSLKPWVADVVFGEPVETFE